MRAGSFAELATRMKVTGKMIESAIAVILPVSNGEISRFRMHCHRTKAIIIGHLEGEYRCSRVTGKSPDQGI